MSRHPNLPARAMSLLWHGGSALLAFAGGLMLAPDIAAAANATAPDRGTQMPGIIGILSHTPLWVWPLILYGLFIGWNRTRDRVVSPPRLFIMPALICGLVLYNLVSAGISAGGLLGFACGAVAGTLAVPPGCLPMAGWPCKATGCRWPLS